MKRLWILVLFFAIPAFGQDTYKNVNGVVVRKPTPTMIDDPVNLQCADGWYSHSLNDSGACADHGGFAKGVTMNGGGNVTCDKKCKEGLAIAAGAVVTTVVVIKLVERHKEHEKEIREFCEANPTGQFKKTDCAKWLAKHDKKQ